MNNVGWDINSIINAIDNFVIYTIGCSLDFSLENSPWLSLNGTEIKRILTLIEREENSLNYEQSHYHINLDSLNTYMYGAEPTPALPGLHLTEHEYKLYVEAPRFGFFATVNSAQTFDNVTSPKRRSLWAIVDTSNRTIKLFLTLPDIFNTISLIIENAGFEESRGFTVKFVNTIFDTMVESSTADEFYQKLKQLCEIMVF